MRPPFPARALGLIASTAALTLVVAGAPAADAAPSAQGSSLASAFTQTSLKRPLVPVVGKAGDGRTTIVDPVNRTGRLLVTGNGSYLPAAVRAAQAARPQVEATTQQSTIDVSYEGTFSDNQPAQQAFQRAVDIWESIVSSSVPIHVDATLKVESDKTVLGEAGPNGFVSFNGVYFAEALGNALAGKDMNGSAPEITAEFNDNPQIFYYGADPEGIKTAVCHIPGSTPVKGNCYDFESVVLHELGHGLGFIGSAGPVSDSDPRAAYGFDYPSNTKPLIYDLFTETSDGKPILDYPNHSLALTDALTSNEVYWNGPEGAGADRGREPRLYADDDQSKGAIASHLFPGSSYSHLSDVSYPDGDPDSLMTPYAEAGDVTRDPGEIMLGMMRDMGWTTPNLPGLSFVPLASPVQVYDSGKVVGSGNTGKVLLAGSFGIPATATAVALNLTGSAPYAQSAQLFAYARPRPGVAPPKPRVPSLIIPSGYTKDSLVTVPLGYRSVWFSTMGGGTRNYASAVGYYVATGGEPFAAQTPSRFLDTRTGTGTPKARLQTTTVEVTIPNLPSSATAVALDVTALNPSTLANLQVFSSDLSSTSVSSLRLKPGVAETNLVIAKVGSNHTIAMRTTAGGADVEMDIVGWFDASGTGLYRPLLPERLFGPQKLGQSVVDVKPVGEGEGYGVPVRASALILSSTISSTTDATTLSVYPTGAATGTTAVSAPAKTSASGSTITPPSAGGKVRIANTVGSGLLSVDLFGYFAP